MNIAMLLWAFISVAFNYLFLIKLVETSTVIVGILAAIVLFLGFVIIYALVLQKYIAKYLLAILIIGNSATLYFMQTYNIEVDKIMMINVFQTDSAEVGALISVKMLWILLLDVFLFYLLFKSDFNFQNWKEEFRARIKLIIMCGSLLALILLPFANKLDTFIQERKYLLYLLTPTNYISSTISAIKIMQKHDAIKPLNKQAEVNQYWNNKNRKNLIVIVVGESVRDANYSLSGYQRDTNGYLVPFKNDMMVFNDTVACGTSTSISVPCLFSSSGRKDFIPGSASYLENVLDVFKYNGYKVIWRENNSSCKGNCARIITEVFCQDNSCPDGLMQSDLKDKLKTLNDNAVMVLHQYGSHGPDYFLRYPEEFEKYKPVCKSQLLKDCTYDEIVNAYDNSIIYNSYLMAELLKDLQGLDDEYNVAVFYTSDHGESLGENGVYLHSAVYDRAPKYQTEVPFWVWMPKYTKLNMNYENECLMQQTKKKISHDYLFHSLLGLAGLKIEAYNPELDIFAECRNN